MQKYAIAIFALLALQILWLFSPTLDKHEGTAAWVQAVGAIIAIAATAWIASRETRETHKREAIKKQQLWESIATISENGIAAFKKLNDACSPYGDQRAKFIEHYTPSDFDVPIDALASIPLHEIGDTNLITAVVNMRGIMGNVQKKLTDAYRNLDNPLILFNLDFLGNQKTTIFNAHANVWRSVHGNAREDDLRRFT